LLNEPSGPTDFAESSSQGIEPSVGASARSFVAPTIGCVADSQLRAG